MDTTDDLKQEEKVETPVDGADVSLDDMMAAAVPADDAPSQDGLAQDRGLPDPQSAAPRA